MLHVHAGSVLLERLASAGIPGERLEWSEVPCAGPLRSRRAGRAHAERAEFLDRAFGRREGTRTTRESLEQQDLALIAATRRHDEIVLWAGAEWFCQSAVVELLARVGPAALRRGVRLSLACPEAIDDAPSAGCGLGRWPDARLAELLDARSPLDARAVRQAWSVAAALRARDPREVETVASQGGVLPHVQEGLARHVRELPHAGSGLGATEQAILEAIEAGAQDVPSVLASVVARETRPYQTDVLVEHVVARLADASLVARGDGSELALLASGRDALAGERDATRDGTLDRWVGGVRADRRLRWRWDDSLGCVRALY